MPKKNSPKNRASDPRSTPSAKPGANPSAGALSSRKVPARARRAPLIIAGTVIGLLIAGLGLFALSRRGGIHPADSAGRLAHDSPYTPRPAGTITYAKDIAPIVFNHCAGCHRPGQSGPFPLLSYAETKKHSRQIAEVTARRYMPPWLPEPGYGDFADSRRLSAQDLGLIQQWIQEGAPEGDTSSLPPLPRWADDWQIGPPDLIVDLPPFTLQAEGKDVYRNLVAPIPTTSNRFVRAIEFRPGNPKVVHHAFVNVDETRQSQRLAAKQNPPGFDGMDLPESAVMPGGQLLGWQPGKLASGGDDGLSWVLKTNTDLVLQLHLHPSGKPESIQPRVGFYFTDQPPRTVPFRLRLVRFDFELPAGARETVVEQSYVLPVDVDLVRVLPHCHYLGKDLKAYAVLPGGEQRSLLWIKDWDFNWQGDYKYASPISLPRGSKLVMRFTYDNSEQNPRNPNSPPKTVRHGLQTTDEMAALAFQAVVRTPQDRAALAEDYFNYFRDVSMDYYRARLRWDPTDVEAHVKLGRALFAKGATDEALGQLNLAVQLAPNDDRAHYELGFIYLRQDKAADAYREFRAAVERNPEDYQSFGSLGLICLAAGRNDEARTYLQTALRLNPDDPIARRNLDKLNAQ